MDPDTDRASEHDLRRYAGIFEHAAIGMALLDPSGRWIDVNPAFCRIVGYEREQLINLHFEDITHPDDLEYNQRQVRRLIAGEISSFRFDKRYLHAQGRTVWVRMDAALVRTDDGDPDFFLTQVQDITASRQIRDALADSEARLEAILASMMEGIAVIDLNGEFVFVNESGRRILDLTDEELSDRSLLRGRWNCVHPDGSRFDPEEFPAMVTARTGKSKCDVIMGVYIKNGNLRWIQVNTQPVRKAGEREVFAVSATFVDITERLHTERALRNSEERLALALAGADLGLWDWSTATREFEFDAGAAAVLGYEPGEIEPTLDAVFALFHPEDQDEIRTQMVSHLKGMSGGFEAVARVRQKSGSYVWVLARGRVTERNADDWALRVSGTFMDITKWKHLEHRLTQMATTDSLTGLYNRRYSLHRLGRELSLAGRTGSPLSLVLLDLDHFKDINDTHGHDAGDRVLAKLGRQIRKRLRSVDIPVRWGGEEFAIVLPGTNLDGAVRLAGELLEVMQSLDLPEIGGISASFGVVEYRPGESDNELMARADRLLYQAKRNGRCRIETE